MTQNIAQYGLGTAAAVLASYGTFSLTGSNNWSGSVDLIRATANKIIKEMQQNPDFDAMDLLDPLNEIDSKAENARIRQGILSVVAGIAAFALTVKATSLFFSNK